MTSLLEHSVTQSTKCRFLLNVLVSWVKKSPKFDFPQFNRSDLFFLLTAVFFETGAMFTPTKSGNGTNCGSKKI